MSEETKSELTAEQLGQISGGKKKNPISTDQGNGGNVFAGGGADEGEELDPKSHRLRVT